MFKTLAIAGGSAAAILIVWAVAALQSSQSGPASPPLAGWMQNFTPADAPGPAPRTPFAGRDGSALTLADFRGKVVLVNFWATWCAPCVREMPSLVGLQRKLAGTGFVMLALSQDLKGWAAIDPFVKRYSLAALQVYLDRQGAFARALGVRGLPTSILFGRDGRELGRLEGIAEWDSAEAVALMRYYLGADAAREKIKDATIWPLTRDPVGTSFMSGETKQTYPLSQRRGRLAWPGKTVGFIDGKAVLVTQKTEPVPIRLKRNGAVPGGPVLTSGVDFIS